MLPVKTPSVSIKDVARLAGVSISTVSNVLRGNKAVSDSLRQQVHNAVQKLGYQPNPIASGLKSKSTMSIAIAIADIHRIFFPQVIKGIQEVCSERGYLVNICDTNDSLAEEQRVIQNLVGNWVDGIILDSVCDGADAEYIAALGRHFKGRKRIPCVSLERDFHAQGIDSVVVHNARGGEMAAQHLIETGCTRFVYLSGPPAAGLSAERLRGFCQALSQRGLQFPHSHVLQADYAPASGYRAMRDFLQREVSFDGVFAASDQLAIGAIKAMREVGLRIPEDVRIVGFDNTFVASFVEPSLTTIHVPKLQMGRRAAELLLERIANPDRPAELVEVPIRLVVRQSTDLKGDRSWDLLGW